MPSDIARCKQSEVHLVISWLHTTFSGFEFSADDMAKTTQRRQTRAFGTEQHAGKPKRQRRTPQARQFWDQCSEQATPPLKSQLSFPAQKRTKGGDGSCGMLLNPPPTDFISNHAPTVAGCCYSWCAVVLIWLAVNDLQGTHSAPHWL